MNNNTVSGTRPRVTARSIVVLMRLSGNPHAQARRLRGFIRHDAGNNLYERMHLLRALAFETPSLTIKHAYLQLNGAGTQLRTVAEDLVISLFVERPGTSQDQEKLLSDIRARLVDDARQKIRGGRLEEIENAMREANIFMDQLIDDVSPSPRHRKRAQIVTAHSP